MKRLVLIDGDELVYKAGFASQHKIYHVVCDGEIVQEVKYKKDAVEWIGDDPDGKYTIESVIVPDGEETARFSLYGVLNTILKDIEHDDYRVYLSGTDNFREKVATLVPYKGNRSESSKPVYYSFIKSILVNEYSAETVDGIEADDALSITQWYHYLNPSNWETIMATQDKDLKMVPGNHYNPSKRESFQVNPWEGRLSFYVQLLTGDSTDNIPGIYRVGPVKAEKLLRPYEKASNDTLLAIVGREYEDAHKSPAISDKMPGDLWGKERITEIARLLWMLQSRDQMWEYGVDYYERAIHNLSRSY